MWKKLLKFRDIAKSFFRVTVRNGENTSFWYDSWLSMGRLYDVTGLRGFIDMGISSQATVGMVLRTHRKRRHPNGILNTIEAHIKEHKEIYNPLEVDTPMWKMTETQFLKQFKTKRTWKLLRQNQPWMEWY